MLCATRVAAFAQRNAVGGRCIKEAFEGRQMHRVGRWPIVGHVAAVHDLDSEGRDEGFCMGQALRLGKRWNGFGVVAVHLGDIENAVAAREEALFLAVFRIGFLDLFPKHDGAGALALAYDAAQFEPLLERAPEAGRISLRLCRGPKRERVDAAIGLLRADVGGAIDGAAVMMPGHAPRFDAAFNRSDDLFGDAGIDARAVITGHWTCPDEARTYACA